MKNNMTGDRKYIDAFIFELIRVAIGAHNTLSSGPSAREWQMLYDMTKKHSLVGICFAGVQRLAGDADSINHTP